jgi:hypothetical protein
MSGITQLFGLSGKYRETTSLSRGVLHQGSVDLSPGIILVLSKDTRFKVFCIYKDAVSALRQRL